MAEIDSILVPGQSVNKQLLRQYLAAREIARPQDYGAVGDGIHDDTEAINTALAEQKAIYLPRGVYRITGPIVMHYGNSILGMGDESVIQAQDTPLDLMEAPPYSSDFNAIEIVEGYCIVENIKIVGGGSALFLAGKVIVSNVPKTKIYSVSSVTINVTLPLAQASNLNQRQLWFLGRVQQGLISKADDIEAAWGVTLRTAKRDIAGLIDLRLIRFSGARKNGRYQLSISD